VALAVIRNGVKYSQLATEPFVLLAPTYGDGDDGGAVPKEVVKFLNVEGNRNFIRGVIAAGNTKIGDAFCLVETSSRPSAAHT
jgi:protein involved in ribonucleotide reduction